METPLLIKAYFSPFKKPKLYWYFGKVVIGVPYFFPRVWRKATPKKAVEETLKEMKRVREHNEKEPTYKQTVKTFKELYEQKLNSYFTQPKKIGFDFRDVGYKTKWSSTDYRHEFNPVWSFVFFKWQIAVRFVPENDMQFWESYLFYSKATDKSKSTKERIEEAMRKFPNIWTSHSAGKEEKINYWDLVLKKKYLNAE